MAPEQIVLATDFSPASAAARSIAVSMAQLFKCRILIVHVFQYVLHHRYAIPVGWMVDNLRHDVQRQMKDAQNALTDLGIETETLLIEDGAPTVGLLKIARSYKAPLIVMGTHAIAGMDRFLLGSTAEGVLRGATCPVITVGPHVHIDDRTNSIGRLLFATDFTKESLIAIPFIAMLRDASGALLQVVHVQTEVGAEKSFDPALFASLRPELDCPTNQQHHPATEYLTSRGTAIAQAITDQAERLPADLIVLGVKHASAFATHLSPKVAFQVIAASPCAVLTASPAEATGEAVAGVRKVHHLADVKSVRTAPILKPKISSC